MMLLLWWGIASVAVSLFVGAFLVQGRRMPERTIDLDRVEPQLRTVAGTTADAPSVELTPASPPAS